MKFKLLSFACGSLIASTALACTVVVGSDDDDTDEITESDDTDEGDSGASDETETDDPETDARTDTDEVPDAGGGTDAESDGTDADDDDPAAGDAGTDDDELTDPATGDDAGAAEGDGGGDAPSGGTTKSGSIMLTQQSISVLDQAITSTTALATFTIFTQANADGDADAAVCETETAGSCTLTVCDLTSGSPSAGGTSMQVSAGDISIDGLASEIVLSSDATSSYTPVSGMTQLWEGGEAVSASAPGSSDVPEFSVDATAPSAVTLTAPVLDLATPLAVSTSADLELSWSEGEDGNVTLTLSETTDDDVSLGIYCSVPVSDGGLTVDATLLAGFAGPGALAVAVAGTGHTSVGDWTISLSASATLAAGLVEFED